MLKKIAKVLMYNEKHPFIQKNVLVLTQLVLLQSIVIVYNIITGNLQYVIVDIPVIAFVIVIWWLIKKYQKYYSNIVFIIFIPLLSWVIFESIKAHGLAGAVWSFPITAALSFCFYKYLAWIANLLIIVVTSLSCIYLLEADDAIRVITTLIMVAFCFTAVFLNAYQLYDEVKDKANRDPMTKLLNRSLLKKCLLDSISEEKTAHSALLISIDIDHFKYINDTFGHAVGDTAIINVAKQLKAQFKNTKTIFRIGGEEFLILLTDTDIKYANELTEKLRANIEKSDLLNNNHKITISIGVANYQPADNWEIWLKRADSAMYQAKKSGRNKVIIDYVH